jgi:hypothetical protein
VCVVGSGLLVLGFRNCITVTCKFAALSPVQPKVGGRGGGSPSNPLPPRFQNLTIYVNDQDHSRNPCIVGILPLIHLQTHTYIYPSTSTSGWEKSKVEEGVLLKLSPLGLLTRQTTAAHTCVLLSCSRSDGSVRLRDRVLEAVHMCRNILTVQSTRHLGELLGQPPPKHRWPWEEHGLQTHVRAQFRGTPVRVSFMEEEEEKEEERKKWRELLRYKEPCVFESTR